MEEKPLLSGTVRTVVYQNEENGYAVLKLDSQDGVCVTVVGTIPMPAPGEELTLSGEYTNHATYGQQFKGELVERLPPTTAAGILAYLSGGAVPGIGGKTAEKLVTAFGDKTLEVLEKNPQALQTQAGLTLKRARALSDSYRSRVCARLLLDFLAENNIDAAMALRAYRLYGDNAAEQIQENPYLLTQESIGVSFTQADALAIALGIPADDPRRVEAGVLYELEYNLTSGHVFLPRTVLVSVTAQMLGLNQTVIDAAVGRLAEEEAIVLDQVGQSMACYLRRLHEAETYTAQRLLRLSRAQTTDPEQPLPLEALEAQTGCRYADAQRQAIEMARAGELLAITGGPGTGKTTTVKGILALYDRMGLTTLLAAPTGRAAKRMEELCGREASTIHRMLETQFDAGSGQMRFFHDEECPLRADAVIVDEVSMLDIQLMAALLRALPEPCRLILVGDRDQLPSVGPGRVLSALLSSGVVPTVCLTEIFRQARQSLIVLNAHAVNRGELPVLNIRDRDFFFLRRQKAEDAVQTICELCRRRLPENMGIPADQIQVLSPTRKYETGTVNLNRRLQETLNPPAADKPQVTFGDYLFRLGDRVMQVRNNYDIIWTRDDGVQGCGVFNGDVGAIQALSTADKTLTVRFDDRTVDYGYDSLPDLEPAYAITVHKSQGSEYRAVILSVLQGAPQLLSRSVLYTAITRARDLLILVGSEETIAEMTNNSTQSRRYSALRYRLTEESGEQHGSD